jgi:hypothetical protein
MKKPLVLSLLLAIWVLKTWPSLLAFPTLQSHSRFPLSAFQVLFNLLFPFFLWLVINSLMFACSSLDLLFTLSIWVLTIMSSDDFFSVIIVVLEEFLIDCKWVMGIVWN